MSNVLRTYKLSQSAMERLRSDIEADDPELVGQIVAALLSKLSLKRIKAWREVMRIAEVNEDTESVRITFLTNEILVLPKIPREDEE